MASATITSKGQITIPAQVRNELGLKTGDRVDFIKNLHGRYTLLPKNGSIRDLKGMFGKFSRTVSIEEMNEAIARGATGEPEPDSPGEFETF